MNDHAFSALTEPPTRARARIEKLADGRRGDKVLFVVDQLRADILARRLPPAARLIEGRLTARFAVSRGPVREALARLHSEGLVELVVNRGAFVRQLTAQDVADLFEVRAELESLAAKRAARAAGQARRGALSPLHQALQSADQPNSSRELLAQNERFHAAIFALAGNRSLDALRRPMHLSFVAQIGPIFSDAQIRLLERDHAAISRAILEGDEVDAAEAMRSHVQKAAAVALASMGGQTAKGH